MAGACQHFVTDNPIGLGGPITPEVRRLDGGLALLSGQPSLVGALKTQLTEDLTKLLRRNL